MNLPNSLTVLRILLAPFVVWQILTGEWRTAAVLFAIASLTDFLDGWTARHRHQTTTFGQFADPVADKVLLSGTFLAFGITGAIPFWLVAVVFGRDLYLLLASLIAMKWTSLREYRPTAAGKLHTAIQILYLVLLLVSEAFGSANLHKLADLLVWPIALLALWTGSHYTLRGILNLKAD
jgi:cardiolipin synthase